MGGWYGLDGKPITMEEAARLFRDPARHIGLTHITTDAETIEVSTVHLVLDHQYGDGPPVLWETMTFGGPADQEQRRYSSRDAAVTGHEAMIMFCLAALDTAGVAVRAVENVTPPPAQ